MTRQFIPDSEVYLAGIDLAWQGERNPTAIAIGKLQENHLVLQRLHPAIYGIKNIWELVVGNGNAHGIAIDAPLIIKNTFGKRRCETEISRCYGSRHAGCHPSNLTLYPDAHSVQLSSLLEDSDYHHLGSGLKWQIEVYPHPAIIEIFGLHRRLAYKKGSVYEKRAGQSRLAEYIMSLQTSRVLKLQIPAVFREKLDKKYITSLSGRLLKQNEDSLDAIICLYIAGLYHIDVKSQVFGDTESGYIWVPQVRCIQGISK